MADGGAKPPAKTADNVSICSFIGQLCREYITEQFPCSQKTLTFVWSLFPFSLQDDSESQGQSGENCVCQSVLFVPRKTNVLNIRLLYNFDVKYPSLLFRHSWKKTMGEISHYAQVSFQLPMLSLSLSVCSKSSLCGRMSVSEFKEGCVC